MTAGEIKLSAIDDIDELDDGIDDDKEAASEEDDDDSEEKGEGWSDEGWGDEEEK